MVDDSAKGVEQSSLGKADWKGWFSDNKGNELARTARWVAATPIKSACIGAGGTPDCGWSTFWEGLWSLVGSIVAGHLAIVLEAAAAVVGAVVGTSAAVI